LNVDIGMFDERKIFEQLKEIFDEETAQRLVRVFASVFEPLESAIQQADRTLERREAAERAREVDRRFDRIDATLERITQIQARTDERLDELAAAQRQTEARMDSLAEAQRQTEQRLDTFADRMDRLADAQAQTEKRLEALGTSVDALTEAQQRTEQRLDTLADRIDQLADAQAQTEKRLEALGTSVDALTEAQARTWEEVQDLNGDMRDVRQQLGGLSHTVGYELENRAYVSLPGLLERDHGIVAEEPLYRSYVTDRDGNPMEINIVADAHQAGEPVRIAGEAKAQLSKNDIDRFLRKRVGRLPDDGRRIVTVLLTHMISEHDAEDYARENGIILYYSYQL
jgi:chaperonin cofactor prefoldin